jgi:hypothetical protein
VLIEDPIHHEVLSVIVVSPIAVDPPAAEELHEKFQGLDASFALNDREPRLHLPTDPHLRTAMDRTTETAFTVDEADDPSLESWPFLLIARTRRIVTWHAKTLHDATDTPGTAGCSGVPAFSQLHSSRHRDEGQQAGGRNLPATLGPFLILRVATGLDHIFTRMWDKRCVRRMASEDSGSWGAGLSC